jgi:TolB-like protein
MERDQLSRKLAVILHADVVGSTSLVQQNETLAHERIQAAFHHFSETIKTYGGIARELRGDALVAEFERASDAVPAALAFQVLNDEFNSRLQQGEELPQPETQTTPKRALAENSQVSEKPSIAVLPFANMSNDPEQEYFADGIVEDIITALSHIRQWRVVARNSSFVYKGRNVDIREVARDLSVRYVLEGSVRKSGNRLRITGQLIDAESGTHLWADKFDGDLVNVFELQDKITESVVGAIEPSLRVAEIERSNRKLPDDMGAYDLYLKALPNLYAMRPDQNKTALDL